MKALLLALKPKGKAPMGMKGKSDMPMGEEPDDADDVENEEADSLFISAAKDGDWKAALDALKQMFGKE